MNTILTGSKSNNNLKPATMAENQSKDTETTGSLAMTEQPDIFDMPVSNYDSFTSTNPFYNSNPYSLALAGEYMGNQSNSSETGNTNFYSNLSAQISALWDSGLASSFGGAGFSGGVSSGGGAGSFSGGGGFTSVG